MNDIYLEFYKTVIDGFTVTLKFIDEDCDPANMLYDVETLQGIYRGDYTWLIAHVQVYKCDIELSNSYLGGIVYEWAKLEDVIIDIFPEMALDALIQARLKINELKTA